MSVERVKHLEELRSSNASDEEMQAHIEVCPVCHANASQLALNPADIDVSADTLQKDAIRAFNPARIAPGTTIGKFKILKLLGHGGIAYVYLAEDMPLSREVAIKFLQHTSSTVTLEQFVAQAREMSNVKAHRHIVQVYQVYVRQANGEVHEYLGKLGADDIPFVVMEYIRGAESIGTLIEDKRQDCCLIRDLARQICHGLQAIHDTKVGGKSVIHYDIKPHNILIEKQRAGDSIYEVKINDFGVGSITTQYAAPELKDPPHVFHGTVRSDLYSLGLTLFELCVGRRPPADPEVMKRDLRNSPFRAIILKLLQENPADRFASAREVANRLETLRCGDCRVCRWRWPGLLLIVAGAAGVYATIWLPQTTFNQGQITLPRSVPQATLEVNAAAGQHDTLDERTKTAGKAFELYNRGKSLHDAQQVEEAAPHFRAATQAALTVVRDFKGDAVRVQHQLESRDEPLPPVWQIEEPLRRQVMNRGQLNDVAVCLWIIGRSSEYLGDHDSARHAYQQAETLTYARAYDPEQDAFWSPAQKASDDLATLNDSHPPHSHWPWYAASFGAWALIVFGSGLAFTPHRWHAPAAGQENELSA